MHFDQVSATVPPTGGPSSMTFPGDEGGVEPQVLQARMAALTAAVAEQQSAWGAGGITLADVVASTLDRAATFEAWLLRVPE